MTDTYRNAIDHLEFSEIRLDAVLQKSATGRHFLRVALIAAVLLTVVVTTTFASIGKIRQVPTEIETIGTVQAEMTDAEPLHFTTAEEISGVSIHYMDLAGPKLYSFHHGMLKDPTGQFYRITEDYQLESMEMRQVNHTINKGSKIYRLDFTWIETEKGILSSHRYIYQPDENGEIFLNATNGRSGQWPVYLNTVTGEVRDALPDFQPDDFTGRIGYAYQIQGGIVVSTVVEATKAEKGYNLLFWIEDGSTEARNIALPENARFSIEHGYVYYQNDSGQLYQMEEDFSFHQISEYKSSTYVDNGLLMVSVNKKLGILDVQTGDVYVLDDISLTPPNFMELLDYSALRYGSDGSIALIHTEWVTAEERIEIKKIGILNTETAQLQMLDIENDYNAYQGYWLDENRFAVIYKDDLRQYLCIYEFSA